MEVKLVRGRKQFLQLSESASTLVHIKSPMVFPMFFATWLSFLFFFRATAPLNLAKWQIPFLLVLVGGSVAHITSRLFLNHFVLHEDKFVWYSLGTLVVFKWSDFRPWISKTEWTFDALGRRGQINISLSEKARNAREGYLLFRLGKGFWISAPKYEANEFRRIFTEKVIEPAKEIDRQKREQRRAQRRANS